MTQHQQDEVIALADPEQRQKSKKELDRTWLTGEDLIKELLRWNAAKAEFLGKEFLIVPPPPGDAKHMLEAMGILFPDMSIVIS